MWNPLLLLGARGVSAPESGAIWPRYCKSRGQLWCWVCKYDENETTTRTDWCMTLIAFLYRIHTNIPVFCSAFPIRSQWKPTISQTREDHRTIAIAVHTLIRHTCRVTKVGFFVASVHQITHWQALGGISAMFAMTFTLIWGETFSSLSSKIKEGFWKSGSTFWSVWQSQCDGRMLHFVSDQHEQAFCLQNDT